MIPVWIIKKLVELIFGGGVSWRISSKTKCRTHTLSNWLPKRPKAIKERFKDLDQHLIYKMYPEGLSVAIRATCIMSN